jgi:hypothetical protein
MYGIGSTATTVAPKEAAGAAISRRGRIDAGRVDPAGWGASGAAPVVSGILANATLVPIAHPRSLHEIEAVLGHGLDCGTA